MEVVGIQRPFPSEVVTPGVSTTTNRLLRVLGTIQAELLTGPKSLDPMGFWKGNLKFYYGFVLDIRLGDHNVVESDLLLLARLHSFSNHATSETLN